MATRKPAGCLTRRARTTCCARSTIWTRPPRQKRLQTGRSGRPICPAGGTDYGNYFSGNRLEALEALIAQAGVRRDRVVAVEQTGFGNAAAVLCEGRNGEMKRLIIWDPQFLGDLDREAGTRWASVAILAHEIAHHLNLDTGQQRRPTSHESKEQELSTQTDMPGPGCAVWALPDGTPWPCSVLWAQEARRIPRGKTV